MEEVIKVFNTLGIDFTIIRHPAVFCKADREKIDNVDFGDGVVCKNLFLKDKKKDKFYLVSLPLDKRADLKKISDELGSSRLSFGNDEELWENLHIKAGSVSILNVIGAPNTHVTFVIDKEILTLQKVSFHPNDNTASVVFSPKDIEKIMNEYSKEYMYLDVEG